MAPNDLPPSAESCNSWKPTRRDAIVAAGTGAVALGAYSLLSRLGHDTHEHDGPRLPHTPEHERRRILQTQEASYRRMMRLADTPPENIYTPDQLIVANALRPLAAGCMDRGVEGHRFAELPRYRDILASRNRRFLGMAKLPIAGTGALLRTPEDMARASNIILRYGNEVKDAFDARSLDEVLCVSKHEGCGAATARSQELHGAKSPDQVANESAEEMRSRAGLREGVLRVGIVNPDVQLFRRWDWHSEQGTVAKMHPFFNPTDLRFADTFEIMGSMGERQMIEELGLSFDIARGSHGVGETWLEEHPFGVVFQGESRDEVQLMREWSGHLLREWGRRAQAIDLVIPRSRP